MQPSGSGINCFKCRAPGHKSAQCRKENSREGKQLLIEDFDEEQGEDESPTYDEDDEDVIVYRDIGQSLVTRKAFIAPKYEDSVEWLRNNIFQTTCTIGGRVCKLIIDSGSCENMISQVVVSKLNLPVEAHLQPYKLSWFKKGNEISVTKRCLVNLSIGNGYFDKVWCDVVIMDACHILFGQPWQYDNKVQHDGNKNSYTFYKDNKIILVPTKDAIMLKPKQGGGVNLLSMAKFEDELKESDVVYILIAKEVFGGSDCPSLVQPLLEEFADVMPQNLPQGLHPMRDIQHHIDLIPGAVLPNRPHYRMSPKE